MSLNHVFLHTEILTYKFGPENSPSSHFYKLVNKAANSHSTAGNAVCVVFMLLNTVALTTSRTDSLCSPEMRGNKAVFLATALVIYH